MKTAGLDTVLSALKGDSNPINADKGQAGEGGAFNAAFDAAARNASETGPLGGANQSSVDASSDTQTSQLAGNVLPEDGKELPNAADTRIAEFVNVVSAEVTTAPISALAPSPFMKAALDKAAVGSALETPAVTVSQSTLLARPQQSIRPETLMMPSHTADISTGRGTQSMPAESAGNLRANIVLGQSSPSHFAPASAAIADADAANVDSARIPASTLPPAEKPSAASRLFGQDLVAASKSSAVSSEPPQGPGSQSSAVAGTANSQKDQNLPAMPRSVPVAPVNPTATGLPVSPPPINDIAGTYNPAPNPTTLARTSSESGSRVQTGLSGTLDGGAGQGTSPARPILKASNVSVTQTQVTDGSLNRSVGGAVSVAQTSDSATAGLASTGNFEVARGLQGESFAGAMDSSLIRGSGFREGSTGNNQPGARAPDASAQTMAGLNPTPRPAEASAVSAATQLPDIKASPDAAGFSQEVVARVRMIQGQGGTEARLNLHPAELGRLQIAITSEGDATRVAFVVDNAQAKEALEQAMPRLREFLQQAGLQLAEGSVSQQGQHDSAEFAQNNSRPDDIHGTDPDGVEEDGLRPSKSDQSSDPNRIFDAYA